MEPKSPFLHKNLDAIFKISSVKNDLVISRENQTLEFKESFGWNSLGKYLKTCAAYANTKGGYIVFGISNHPHLLKGLKEKSFEAFNSIDPEQIANHFNEHFSPEIKWDIHEYKLAEKNFGLFYIHESQYKPVICCKNSSDELKEGDIYYRYRGRSQRIKYPELRTILDFRREQEQQLWMNHLKSIARIGVRDSGIFDLHTGQITGLGGSFLIDESLLSQLSFIKEGEFSEIKGKPTLKLIGKLKPVNRISSKITTKEIIKTRGIRISDIILGFLNQETSEEPQEFVKQICFESTAFLPVYYYIKKAGINRKEAVEMINGLLSRSTARSKLIKRLELSSTQYLLIPNNDKETSIKKQKYAEILLAEKVNDHLSDKDLECCLQAIRGLKSEAIKAHDVYLRKLLKVWFNQHYSSATSKLADNIRRTICWIDEALYLEH